MRAFLPVVMLFALGLACAGAGEAPAEPEAPPEPAPVATEPAAEPDTEPPADGPLPKAKSYTSNVYGVCRKYTDCECNPFGTVVACKDEFGSAADAFPADVWTCVLARDCASLCSDSAGVCFELYALEATMAAALGDQVLGTCPEGQSALHHFDAAGRYESTECK